MKQHEAVIMALEKLGGQATLADLYRETMKVKGPTWNTKTPFASMRRIVQQRPEIFGSPVINGKSRKDVLPSE